MIRIALLLLVFSVIILTDAGCNKESNGKTPLQSGCFTEVFSVPSWYTDSIFYSDNKISRINKTYRNDNTRNTEARLEYTGNQVKISVRDFSEGAWRDVIYYMLTYSTDSKILQVETNSGRARTNYFYDLDDLKYILYTKENKVSDSIVVQFDGAGNNIAKALWFKFDQTNNNFQLANTIDYFYDTKINPHKNSIHFLYNFYDSEEYSLDYFNVNNLRTVKSDQVDIHSAYTYNEYDYPTYVVFYDGTNEETDRNSIAYICK